jgi:signal transduction histidine kinase/ActR/RegA family two-component response regulator
MDRNDILADVNVACRTAVDILNDLLCLDKMESGIMEVHKHVVPVMPFIFDCVGMFSAQAREGCVAMSVVTNIAPSTDTTDITTDPSDSLLHLSLLESDIVCIDRFKMDQVVRNLISNALKFTPKGGSVTLTASFVPDNPADPVLPKGSSSPCYRPQSILTRMMDTAKRLPISRATKICKIHLSPDYLEGDLDSTDGAEVPTTVSGKLVIVVKDTGAGMLKEDYSRLFKEIVQFNPEVLQAGGGSGLGLWITKGIVDLHGGTVSAYSEGLGRGSSFVVELLMERKVSCGTNSIAPLTSTPLTSTETFSSVCPVSDSLKVVSRKSEILHLLVVDDSPLNRKMLLRTLRAVGHICEEAEDGLEAVEKVKSRMASAKKSYSAILIDFVMPNMDGPTATKEIRAMGYTAPIFGVTGNILTSDIDYFIGCGADRVLGKPLNMSIFRSCIDELIPCYSV